MHYRSHLMSFTR